MNESASFSSTDMTSLKETGKRIRTLRLAKALKQADLAELLHVTPQAVSGWERGSNSVNSEILPNLARVLDVSIDHLLCGSASVRFAEKENAVRNCFMPDPAKLRVMTEPEEEAYRNDIMERTKDAPDDIQKDVWKAFETRGPLRDIFRLLIESYCGYTWLEPDSFPFSHVLAIIPCLKTQREIDRFAGMLNLDPDVYMMYALAPYVSKDLLGYWSGLCDFRRDAAFAARLVPLLSEEDRPFYAKRAFIEMDESDVAKHFPDFEAPSEKGG